MSNAINWPELQDAVFNQIPAGGSVTITEVAVNVAGFTRGQVAKSFKHLEEAGKIVRSGERENPKGKASILYKRAGA